MSLSFRDTLPSIDQQLAIIYKNILESPFISLVLISVNNNVMKQMFRKSSDVTVILYFSQQFYPIVSIFNIPSRAGETSESAYYQ